MKNLGFVLILVGIVMVAITGFSFVTKKKVVDLGPVEINKDQNHSVNWSPIVGGVLLVAGIAVVLTNKKS